MAIKKSEIIRGVRVKLNSLFKPKCLGDEYLQCEEVIHIADQHIYSIATGYPISLTTDDLDGRK